jgi:DNA mismatch repair protein MLH1
VDSTPLRRALEQVYTTFLPKGGHPFIYLSLLIEPNRVDVNVHPTKREVGFLNEEEIIEKISGAVQKKLGEGDSTRRFTVQTLLPGAPKPIEATVVEDKGSSFPLRTRGLMGRQETV